MIEKADIKEVYKRLAKGFWNKWPEQKAAAGANDFIDTSCLVEGFEKKKTWEINIPPFWKE